MSHITRKGDVAELEEYYEWYGQYPWERTTEHIDVPKKKKKKRNRGHRGRLKKKG